MSVEFILRCDSCGKPGPKTTTDGGKPKLAVDELRSRADGAFERFRPQPAEPMRDLCPRCAKRARTPPKAKPEPKPAAPAPRAKVTKAKATKTKQASV